MSAHLVEVPGAREVVLRLKLPKAIASSGSRAGLERKLNKPAFGMFRAAYLFSRPCGQCQAGAGSLFTRGTCTRRYTPGLLSAGG